MNHGGLRRLTGAAFLTVAALLPAAALDASAGELAVEGQLGYFSMAASQTATAVFGSSGATTYGGAVRYTFWRGAFASLGARSFAKDGERVFVASATSPVQKLGFPLQMRTTPIFLDLGYRFRNGHTIVPYLSAGGTLTKYRETSSVAGQSYDESVSKAGFVAAAGVEIGRGLLRFAGECGWSTTPGAIGRSDVSKVYGEDDIGGSYAVGKVVLAFGL